MIKSDSSFKDGEVKVEAYTNSDSDPNPEVGIIC